MPRRRGAVPPAGVLARRTTPDHSLLPTRSPQGHSGRLERQTTTGLGCYSWRRGPREPSQRPSRRRPRSRQRVQPVQAARRGSSQHVSAESVQRDARFRCASARGTPTSAGLMRDSGATLGRGASVSCEVERLEGERLEGVFVRNDAVIWLGKERLPCYQGQAEGQEAYAERPHPPGSATAQEARRRPYLLGLLEQRGQTIGGGWGRRGGGLRARSRHMRRDLERPPSQIGEMPPATQNNKKEAMACFHVGGVGPPQCTPVRVPGSGSTG